MSKQFSGKVALVTGAASGIGRVAALIFAREGAAVLVSTDANLEGGHETVNLIKTAGGEASFVKCDVSNEKEVEQAVSTAVSQYGSLDFAFNNESRPGWQTGAFFIYSLTCLKNWEPHSI
jgi:NAD(P)-dependent dehydrogenase (short-subunit alcohol dehydrogenase family)